MKPGRPGDGNARFPKKLTSSSGPGNLTRRKKSGRTLGANQPNRARSRTPYPYFPEIPYNPKDARFLGTPVDFIIFDGLSEGEMNKVVFVEVKSGKTGALSPRKACRECINRGKVSYEIIHNKE